MPGTTKQLWDSQNRHPGDRLRLFSVVADTVAVSTVLYPGSYVDVAPSFVFDDVTYVDADRRAAGFFADAAGVNEIIAQHRADGRPVAWSFLHADYTSDLDLGEERFDLLVSLYAGFISEHCTQYLKRGGYLLVNPSHGDVAMASIDERYELIAVVQSRNGAYHVSTDALATYLVPKRDVRITKPMLRASNRGIGYTRSPFAYLFRRSA